jgi:hypothetical protein
MMPAQQKPKIWKWPTDHPIWPDAGWGISLPTEPSGTWLMCLSWRDALGVAERWYASEPHRRGRGTSER